RFRQPMQPLFALFQLIDARQWSLSTETARTMVASADGTGTTTARGMVVRRTGSSSFAKEAVEVGHVDGEPKAPGLYLTANDSPTRTDSMRPYRCYSGHTASISDETSVVGLQWTGSGHAHKLRV